MTDLKIYEGDGNHPKEAGCCDPRSLNFKNKDFVKLIVCLNSLIFQSFVIVQHKTVSSF